MERQSELEQPHPALSLHPAVPALARSAGTSPVEPPEDVLDIPNIQGNILAGFNKDYQALLFLKIVDRGLARTWVRETTPFIATMEEVLAFNRLFKAMRARRMGEPCGLAATWLNIAFSRDGIAALTSEEEALKFLDEAFQAGLPKRAGLLGDPATAEWIVGGAGSIPDIVLIVASDESALLEEEVARVTASFTNATASGLTLLSSERGATLPAPLTGHEHFGFKDGVSQPAVRGRLSSLANDFLTPRFLDPHDPRAKQFSTPGNALVYPGQFVFGYQIQDHASDGSRPFDPSVTPTWAVNGSYLVFRRLRQRVGEFRAAMQQQATSLTVSPEALAAKLVGRWPSGAPILRTPDEDLPNLGANDFANNHFAFQNASTPVPLQNAPPHAPDTFAQAPADLLGLVCPHAAHIRKANPRDLPTDKGGANDTLARRILRRGIPYGDPLPEGAAASAPENAADRGLLFLSYQTSIVDQFEFLLTDWINSPQTPEAGGFDIVLGQNGADPGRQRTVDLTLENQPAQTLTFLEDFVVPTGGGYFFAPSLQALTTVLSNPPPPE